MTGHFDFVGHLSGIRLEIVAVPGHELLRQSKEIPVEHEEITNSVIVLEPVESPDLNMSVFRVFRCGFAQHYLQAGDKFLAFGVWNLGLILGRHIVGIYSLDQLLQQFWIGPEVIKGGDLLEVDLPLGFFASVALDAVLCKERF